MFATRRAFGRNLLEMSNQLSKIAVPIEFGKINVQNIMPAIWTRRMRFGPVIQTFFANDAMTTRENSWVFAYIEAKQARERFRQRFDRARQVLQSRRHGKPKRTRPYRPLPKSSMS
jgi:hypothetical protein